MGKLLRFLTSSGSACIVFGFLLIFTLCFDFNPVAGQSSHLESTTFYVDVEATGANDGSSWEDAFTDLQPAMDAAVSGDQVWVAAGTYLPTVEQCGATERHKTFQLKNGVGVYGGFDPSTGDVGWDNRDWVANPVILSGDLGNDGDPSNNSYHVFCHNYGLDLDNSAVLDGFTISDGNANGGFENNPAAGMTNQASSPTLVNIIFENNSALGGCAGMENIISSSPILTNVTFINNSADFMGGGMCNTSNSSPILTDVTFNNNSAGGEGGGIYNTENSSPTLTNVTFSGNSASEGGGMYVSDSSPTLTYVTFNDNVASNNGGGMYNNSSSPVLTNATFSGNHAEYGGGMVNNNSSSPILTNLSFTNNTATNWGGGMYNWNFSSPTITNSTFKNNTASQGGGMNNYYGSSPTLVNVIFTNNSAVNWGGGMINDDNSNSILVNVTFANNSASSGGALSNWLGSVPALVNCILWGDTPEEISNFDGTAPVITYSDVQGGHEGIGNINVDPLFIDAPGGDLHLEQYSPAIDAGDNAAVPVEITTDLDGNPRFVDDPEVPDTGNGTPPIVDMGAYEYQVPIESFTTITSDNPDPSLPGQPFTVTFEVTSTFGIPTGVVTVTVTEAPVSCSAELADGVGSCSLALDNPGSYTLVADYVGNVLYLTSSDEEEDSIKSALIRSYLSLIIK